MPQTDRNNRPKRQNTRHLGRFTVGAALCGAGAVVGTATGDCGRVVPPGVVSMGDRSVGGAITGTTGEEARGGVGTVGGIGATGATIGAMGEERGAMSGERGAMELGGVGAPDAMSKLNCDPYLWSPESTTSTKYVVPADVVKLEGLTDGVLRQGLSNPATHCNVAAPQVPL
jgi:hypothetical protein